jgi:hypothetical protein
MLRPANANEMIQKSGPVGRHGPILVTVGQKHVIAFFVPGNGQCNVQAVMVELVCEHLSQPDLPILTRPTLHTLMPQEHDAVKEAKKHIDRILSSLEVRQN